MAQEPVCQPTHAAVRTSLCLTAPSRQSGIQRVLGAGSLEWGLGDGSGGRDGSAWLLRITRHTLPSLLSCPPAHCCVNVPDLPGACLVFHELFIPGILTPQSLQPASDERKDNLKCVAASVAEPSTVCVYWMRQTQHSSKPLGTSVRGFVNSVSCNGETHPEGSSSTLWTGTLG